MVIESVPKTQTKASDFKDAKTILDVCGPLAIEKGNSFKPFLTLILYILYNYPEKPKEIGYQLEDIIKEVHEDRNDWFYTDWMDGLDRKEKSTIEIIQEVAEKTKRDNCCNYSDAACYMAVAQSCDLMEIILLYYQNGCPNVNANL